MKNKGFTLIEVVILGFFLMILFKIGYQNYLRGQKESRDMTRRADIEEIQRTLEHYYEDFWQYPKEIKFGLPLEDPDGKGFVHKNTNGIPERIPVDPINKKPYIYTYESKDSENLTYRLCAQEQELSSKSYCFTNDRREQFKKDTQKLYKESEE